MFRVWNTSFQANKKPHGDWKTYLRSMRLDHWIKQLFILPGVGFAAFILPEISSRKSCQSGHLVLVCRRFSDGDKVFLGIPHDSKSEDFWAVPQIFPRIFGTKPVAVCILLCHVLPAFSGNLSCFNITELISISQEPGFLSERKSCSDELDEMGKAEKTMETADIPCNARSLFPVCFLPVLFSSQPTVFHR